VTAAQPNAAHVALKELEALFKVTIITQNIDDLHERAGSSRILHLHGEIMKARSSRDESMLTECVGDIELGDRAADGSQLRPHVVWFGESVPMMDRAIEEVKTADFFIVVGTSLEVYPAASLIDYVPLEAPKFLVDPMPVDIADESFHVVQATASEGIQRVTAQLRAMMA
jgi:NAD-dependent deacetylase